MSQMRIRVPFMTITKVSLSKRQGTLNFFFSLNQQRVVVTYFKIQMGLKNGPWIFLTAERVEKAVGDRNSVTVTQQYFEIRVSLKFSNLTSLERKEQFFFLYFVGKHEENLLFSIISKHDLVTQTPGVKKKLLSIFTRKFDLGIYSQMNFDHPLQKIFPNCAVSKNVRIVQQLL